MAYLTDQQRNRIALDIASRAFMKELAASRALGYAALPCYQNAFAVSDAVYNAAFEPQREIVLERLRMIRT